MSQVDNTELQHIAHNVAEEVQVESINSPNNAESFKSPRRHITSDHCYGVPNEDVPEAEQSQLQSYDVQKKIDNHIEEEHENKQNEEIYKIAHMEEAYNKVGTSPSITPTIQTTVVRRASPKGLPVVIGSGRGASQTTRYVSQQRVIMASNQPATTRIVNPKTSTTNTDVKLLQTPANASSTPARIVLINGVPALRRVAANQQNAATTRVLATPTGGTIIRRSVGTPAHTVFRSKPIHTTNVVPRVIRGTRGPFLPQQVQVARQPQFVEGPSTNLQVLHQTSGQRGARTTAVLVHRGLTRGATTTVRRATTFASTGRGVSTAINRSPDIIPQKVVTIAEDDDTIDVGQIPLTTNVTPSNMIQQKPIKMTSTPRLCDNGACARTLGLRVAVSLRPDGSRAPVTGAKRGRKPKSLTQAPQPRPTTLPANHNIDVEELLNLHTSPGRPDGATSTDQITDNMMNQINQEIARAKSHLASQQAAQRQTTIPLPAQYQQQEPITQVAPVQHVSQQQIMIEQAMRQQLLHQQHHAMKMQQAAATVAAIVDQPVSTWSPTSTSTTPIYRRVPSPVKSPIRVRELPPIVVMDAPPPSTIAIGSSVRDEEESTSSTETDSDIEGIDDDDLNWEGGDYTTRCLCELQHNDDFMIECDQCNVWQHGVCMGVDKKKVPAKYYCERCRPRPLRHDAQQARHLQQKTLARVARGKEKHKQARIKRREAKKQRRLDREKRARRLKSITSLDELQKHTEIEHNYYTQAARSMLDRCSDTNGHDLLLAVSEELARAMFVAAGTMGLVSTKPLQANQPVAEFRGLVCLKNEECDGKDLGGCQLPYVLVYNGFGLESPVTIDARYYGSRARFARHSCRPNCYLKHIMAQGRLHILLLLNEPVEPATELTIPHAPDYRQCRLPVECACSAEHQDCPVRAFNRTLPPPPVIPPSPTKTKKPVVRRKKESTSSTKRNTTLKKHVGRKTSQYAKQRAKYLKTKPSQQNVYAKTRAPAPNCPVKNVRSKRLREKIEKEEISESISNEVNELTRHTSKTTKGADKRSARASARAAAAAAAVEQQKTPSKKKEISPVKQKSPPKSPSPIRNRRRMQTEDKSPAPINANNRHLSREEKKILQAEEMFRKMEQSEKKKAPVIQQQQNAGKEAAQNRRKNEPRRTSTRNSLKKEEKDIKPEPESPKIRPKTRRHHDEPEIKPIEQFKTQPPRKRWKADATNEVEEPKPSTSKSAKVSLQKTPPSMKRRWLRLAEQDKQDDQKPDLSKQTPNPLKKRLKQQYVDEQTTIAQEAIPGTSKLNGECSAEAEKLSSTAPAKITRRKVTIDEYKKRQSTTHDDAKGASPSIASAGESGFMPKVGDAPTTRSSLAPLPDPSLIGKTTSSLEDLKAKILTNVREQDERKKQNGPVPISPPSSPETPQTVTKEVDYRSMTLEERLAKQFGIPTNSNPTTT